MARRPPRPRGRRDQRRARSSRKKHTSGRHLDSGGAGFEKKAGARRNRQRLNEMASPQHLKQQLMRLNVAVMSQHKSSLRRRFRRPKGKRSTDRGATSLHERRLLVINCLLRGVGCNGSEEKGLSLAHRVTTTLRSLIDAEKTVGPKSPGPFRAFPDKGIAGDDF